MRQTTDSLHHARPQEERVAELITVLRRRYTGDPTAIRVVRAPLRISPLGAHIDHQLGRVTGMAVDRSILFAFAPTTDASCPCGYCQNLMHCILSCSHHNLSLHLQGRSPTLAGSCNTSAPANTARAQCTASQSEAVCLAAQDTRVHPKC